MTQWYSDTLHKHAVTHLGGAQKFWYDPNGSMTQRVEGSTTYTQTWDAESRLTGVSGAGTATFVYDSDGNRVKATVNGVTAAYVGAYYEQSGTQHGDHGQQQRQAARRTALQAVGRKPLHHCRKVRKDDAQGAFLLNHVGRSFPFFTATSDRNSKARFEARMAVMSP